MGNLQLAFLDVGQGDTIVIYDPDTSDAVVVDCVNYQQVLDFLEAKKIDRLRAVIITHAHSDHYSGVVDLLDNCSQRGITWDACVFRWDRPYILSKPELLNDGDGHSDSRRRKSAYETLLAWAKKPANKKKHVEEHCLPKASKILGSLTFCHPKYPDLQELYETGSLNNLSYVIRVLDGASALLTGDIEYAGWVFLENNYPELLHNDILKFPHHGVWRDGDIADFLDKTKPHFIVISVGTGNTYKHPSPDVLSAIKKRNGIRLLCTQATSRCCSNPEQISLQTSRLLQTKVAFSGAQNTRPGNGCPCAGTVIIELGKQAKVLSPESKLHNEQIIKPFMNSHQCNLKTEN